jgi:REP element-mobilizing transposase RayT
MTFDPEKHHRRSIRLRNYDYSQPGAYFVTICTYQKQSWFGEIKNGQIYLNQLGKIVADEWLKTCKIRPNFKLDEWVIMPNHVHLIISAAEWTKIQYIMRDFKKFTSRKIVAAITANERESRKDWMLNMFRYAASSNNSTDDAQFWQHDYHPIALDTSEKTYQKLAYLHENPVRAGIVWRAEDYKYNSATDYYLSKPGLLPLILLD